MILGRLVQDYEASLDASHAINAVHLFDVVSHNVVSKCVLSEIIRYLVFYKLQSPMIKKIKLFFILCRR